MHNHNSDHSMVARLEAGFNRALTIIVRSWLDQWPGSAVHDGEVDRYSDQIAVDPQRGLQ
jgi:hypothetical protein